MATSLTPQELSELYPITRDSICSSTMMEHHKEFALQALELANRLSLTIWQPQGEPCYCVMRDGRVWKILDADSYSDHPIRALTDVFEFMISYLE